MERVQDAWHGGYEERHSTARPAPLPAALPLIIVVQGGPLPHVEIDEVRQGEGLREGAVARQGVLNVVL